MHWIAGSDPLGVDCHCVQIAAADHWPSLRAIICVVSVERKATPSTDGMMVGQVLISLISFSPSQQLRSHCSDLWLLASSLIQILV